MVMIDDYAQNITKNKGRNKMSNFCVPSRLFPEAFMLEGVAPLSQKVLRVPLPLASIDPEE